MADLDSGTLVRHATFGVGKIVAAEPNAVHVFFPDSETRFATKLRLPAARAFLRTEGVEPDGWLESLSAFTFESKEGRYALAASWMTHEQAVEKFRAVHRTGFEAPTLRAASWRAAQEAWAGTFEPGEGETLLAAGDLPEVTKRILKLEKLAAALHPPADVGAVKAAFADRSFAGPFFVALFELLGVPSSGRARFDKLFAAARALPVGPEQQWLVATMVPLLAAPARNVIFRPKIACEAAERLGSDLRVDGGPSWTPYSALRALSVKLLDRLAPLGAKDFVDVDAFLQSIATAKRRVERRTK